MEVRSDRAEKPVQRRSRNACDACRARKVKCVYHGPICEICLDLKIPCLQNMPRKRRGPPNRYVQAHAMGETPASFASSDSVSPSPLAVSLLEQLGPFSLIEQIIHDWFDLIHSISPLFHRGVFLKRLANSRTDNDPVFSVLVVSLCATTVTTVRRKSSTAYGVITVQKCLDVFDHFESLVGRQKYTLEWCQTRYNMACALCAERGVDDMDGCRFFADAIVGVKYLVYYEMPSMPILSQQLLKRLYWLLFDGLCTVDMHGRPCIGLLSPKENINALRPLDITDEELDQTQVGEDDNWHGKNKSYVAGLNYLSNLFLLWHASQQKSTDPMAHLVEHMTLVQRALDHLPPELRWRGGLSRPPKSNFGTDAQMANLYITQLHIRSNLLEQMNQLSKTMGDNNASAAITNERRSIVDDLLEILYHMPHDTLEANGYSLIPKVRDIGSALLDEVRTGDQSQATSPKLSDNLDRLLAKLESLDVAPQF